MSPIIGNTSSGGKQPGTPSVGTVTAGNASASVPFTPSGWLSKSSSVNYVATSTPGGITGTSSTSPISVTGLSNGTAYTFTVRADAPYGVSSFESSASNSVTPSVPAPSFTSPSFPSFPSFPGFPGFPGFGPSFAAPPNFTAPPSFSAPSYRRCSTSQLTGGFCCPSGFGGSGDCWTGGAGAVCASPTC